MSYELIRLRPGEYRVTGTIKGAQLQGSVTKVTDGSSQPWMWSAGYRLAPRDRGVWHRGWCRNLASAKAAIDHAVAHMNATEYSPDNRVQ